MFSLELTLVVSALCADAIAMSNPINWNLCIICQKLTTEELCCPTKCASDRSPADCLMLFFIIIQGSGCISVKVDYGGYRTAQILVQNDYGTNNVTRSSTIPCWREPSSGQNEREHQKVMLPADLTGTLLP